MYDHNKTRVHMLYFLINKRDTPTSIITVYFGWVFLSRETCVRIMLEHYVWNYKPIAEWVTLSCALLYWLRCGYGTFSPSIRRRHSDYIVNLLLNLIPDKSMFIQICEQNTSTQKHIHVIYSQRWYQIKFRVDSGVTSNIQSTRLKVSNVIIIIIPSTRLWSCF